MKKETLLCIGYHDKYINHLLHIQKKYKIIVIEEPTLIPKNFHKDIQIYSGKYQQNDDAIEIAQSINNQTNTNITSVIPLREYGVPCTNDIADILNLPKLGKLASRCFRNKIMLRNTLYEKELHYINQPNL